MTLYITTKLDFSQQANLENELCKIKTITHRITNHDTTFFIAAG